MGRFEKWLDRRTPLAEGERELSERARNRAYDKPQGPVAVPKGSITLHGVSHGMRVPLRYSVEDTSRSLPGSTTIMTNRDIDALAEVVDARMLGKGEHRFDPVFEELRSSGAAQRSERIIRNAGRYKRLAALAGAFAVGLAWTAVHLPLPRLVGENNCYEQAGNGDYIQPADSVGPRVAAGAERCELGGQQYIIRHTAE